MQDFIAELLAPNPSITQALADERSHAAVQDQGARILAALAKGIRSGSLVATAPTADSMSVVVMVQRITITHDDLDRVTVVTEDLVKNAVIAIARLDPEHACHAMAASLVQSSQPTLRRAG